MLWRYDEGLEDWNEPTMFRSGDIIGCCFNLEKGSVQKIVLDVTSERRDSFGLYPPATVTVQGRARQA